MFTALTVAVACGCISAEQSQIANGDVSNLKRDRIPSEGQMLQDEWYNAVQRDSYTWTKVSKIKATYALKKSWRADTKVYMHHVLGMGSCGKVYLCMDSKGRHFAVKMLFLDSTSLESFDPEERQASHHNLMLNLKEKLGIEAKRWKTIYPKYATSIWEGTLNSIPCLAMPYVASIPENRRDELLPKIRDEMERLARKGFVYKDGDVRWRHVGLRKQRYFGEEIVFVDMESLEECNPEDITDENITAAVNKFINKLKKRMITKEVATTNGSVALDDDEDNKEGSSSEVSLTTAIGNEQPQREEEEEKAAGNVPMDSDDDNVELTAPDKKAVVAAVNNSEATSSDELQLAAGSSQEKEEDAAPTTTMDSTKLENEEGDEDDQMDSSNNVE